MPIHVASHALPPDSPWVQWWRQNPAELHAMRGLFGQLPSAPSEPGTFHPGALVRHTPWERFPAARKRMH